MIDVKAEVLLKIPKRLQSGENLRMKFVKRTVTAVVLMALVTEIFGQRASDFYFGGRTNDGFDLTKNDGNNFIKLRMSPLKMTLSGDGLDASYGARIGGGLMYGPQPDGEGEEAYNRRFLNPGR